MHQYFDVWMDDTIIVIVSTIIYVMVRVLSFIQLSVMVFEMKNINPYYFYVHTIIYKY